MDENNKIDEDMSELITFLKDEYDRAIVRERTLEYKLGILWTIILVLINNVSELLFLKKDILFLMVSGTTYSFNNITLIYNLLLTVSFLYLSYFSYKVLELDTVLRATSILNSITSKKKELQLLLIFTYCDMLKTRNKRCDKKSKNLNNAIKVFGIFLILVTILYIIKFGGIYGVK